MSSRYWCTNCNVKFPKERKLKKCRPNKVGFCAKQITAALSPLVLLLDAFTPSHVKEVVQ